LVNTVMVIYEAAQTLHIQGSTDITLSQKTQTPVINDITSPIYNIFGRQRPHSIINWCQKLLKWLKTSCVVPLTTVAA